MLYGPEFYRERYAKTIYSAREILSLLLDKCPPISSAVDFGCGVGTWLAALREKGVERILGIEGSWVEPRYLAIPRESYRPHDLEQPLSLNERFDLAISLEVAEHLSPRRADSFVGELCAAADVILFSAAIPGQQGVSHINEQWPDYWATLFNQRGYKVVDFIRPRIWRDKNIQLCYRQNLLVFVNSSKRHAYEDILNVPTGTPLSMVHPEFYSKDLKRVSKTRTLRGITSLGIEWLKNAARQKKQ